MISLQTTLNLNNRAVELFHSNSLPEAAKTFYQSLCIVKELLKCPQQKLNLSPASPTHPANTDTTIPEECFHSSTQTSSNLAMLQENNRLFVYQKALILQEAPSSSRQNSVLQAMNIYCAGILFNAAILHHQNFTATGNSASMDRAQHLYQSSLQLLMGLLSNNNNNTTAAGVSNNGTVILLAVASSNNLAQIELEKGLVIQAGERLRFLSHLLHTTSKSTIERIFLLEEFQGMLSNTLLGNGMISSPAA